MILAGIDIGTNTLRLLIAHIGPGTFTELYSDRRITRLGMGLGRTGRLSPESADRTIGVLRDFAGRIEEQGAAGIAAVGTSALRTASDAVAFIERVRRITGIGIRVISGEEEARLTLLGVHRALGHVPGFLDSALIMDIGGGSTEVIVTGPGGTCSAMSLPLGAVELTERFFRHDPPEENEINEARRAIAGALTAWEPLAARGVRPRYCAGTAGTVTTLAAMDQRLAIYDPGRINGYVLHRVSIDRIVRELASSTLSERRAMIGLEPGREDIILAGALVALGIMDHAGPQGCQEMIVSDWGLREGILLDLYENMTGTPPRTGPQGV